MGEGHGHATRGQMGRLLQEVVRVGNSGCLAELSQVEVIESDESDQHSDACDPVAAKHVLGAWQHKRVRSVYHLERCEHEIL